jgi:adenylate cyclase
MLKSTRSIFSGITPAKRHERKLIFIIALSWAGFDSVFFFWRKAMGILPEKYYNPELNLVKEIVVREVCVFLVSLVIAYFLISVFKNYFTNSSFSVNLLAKTALLLVAGLVMTFLLYITYEWLITGHSLYYSIEKFFYHLFHQRLLLEKMPEWLLLFIATQMAIEINQKYSRGVFFNIMIGKYLQPKEEKRIILFLDLKDSTPIAEKLGHKEYFKFIRDFIYHISAGFLENDGRIYQYVGDEIVVWWPASEKNARKAVASLITARKELHKNLNRFKRRYDTIPEYKAGIHAGNVMVGQVGIIKKDLVMSGDTINTAARIRSACTELNQKFLISKDVNDLLDLKEWQSESIGIIDLKGKNQGIELFALKI